MKYLILLMALCCCSCHPTSHRPQTPKDSVTFSGDQEECIFDTSSYKFTTEKLKAFKEDLVFSWNDKEKTATVKLNGNDTLLLHIGGCYHFGYDAVYTTDALVMHEKEIVEKAGWLATHFFGNGFDEKYIDCLSHQQYTIDSSNSLSWNLQIVSKDTNATDQVYEPVLIEQLGRRVKISMTAYQD